MRWDFLSRSSDTLDKKQRQVLQVPCHLRQEPACIGAVSDPVVEGEGKREDLPDGDLPPVDPRAFDDSAEPEDCHVWPVDDRGGKETPEMDLVGDGERAPFQLIESDSPVTSLLAESLDLSCQFEDAFPVHLPDNRHYQTFGGLHGDTEVVMLLDGDRISCIVDGGIEKGMLPKRMLRRLDEERKKGQMGAAGFHGLLFALAQLPELGDVDLLRDGDEGRQPLGGEDITGDGPPEPAQRQPLHRAEIIARGRLWRRDLFQILGCDTPARAAALYPFEVDTSCPSQFSHLRCGEHRRFLLRLGQNSDDSDRTWALDSARQRLITFPGNLE